MTVSIIPYFTSNVNYRIMDVWISFTSTVYQKVISVTGFQIFMYFSTASISRCNIFSFHLLFHILVGNFVMIHFNKFIIL